uniref:Uncharacterized protein n=1 Tax=Oryza sativa subsp. japonica TaxID=39947 RepID=Q10FE8_ORYSJ|nr:hypothetical protein LOC_Os03g46760 [Oryza sativa Japonica Group]
MSNTYRGGGKTGCSQQFGSGDTSFLDHQGIKDKHAKVSSHVAGEASQAEGGNGEVHQVGGGGGHDGDNFGCNAIVLAVSVEENYYAQSTIITTTTAICLQLVREEHRPMESDEPQAASDNEGDATWQHNTQVASSPLPHLAISGLRHKVMDRSTCASKKISQATLNLVVGLGKATAPLWPPMALITT